MEERERERAREGGREDAGERERNISAHPCEVVYGFELIRSIHIPFGNHSWQCTTPEHE